MYVDNAYMYRQLKSRSCSELSMLLNYKQGHICMVKNPSDYVKVGMFQYTLCDGIYVFSDGYSWIFSVCMHMVFMK